MPEIPMQPLMDLPEAARKLKCPVCGMYIDCAAEIECPHCKAALALQYRGHFNHFARNWELSYFYKER